MREVIFVNVGQAGVQISNAVWELLCCEHSIGADGFPFHTDSSNDIDSFKTVFSEVPSGKYVPRVITIDLEPTVIDEVRTGSYRNLFHPDQLISGYEDAANNYARGHFTMGRKVIDRCIGQIRKVAQACDYVQGFFLIDSLGGGTGSGFSILINERLSIEYAKRAKFQVGVYPSPKMESSVVSPYNTLMNAHTSMDYIDLSVIMDNEATYDICTESLDIQRPTFNNVNRLIAQVLSSMTVSLRFENSLNSDLDQICTNLVPYPRIHFPTSHHAPLHCQSRVEHEILDEMELTRALFTETSQFIKIDCSLGKLMACALQYRGMVSPNEVNKAIFDIKRRQDIQFVDWCPTGFKIGINNFPPTFIPGSSLAQTNKSVTMLSNTTAISQMWIKLNKRFVLLYSKRSFIHWFVGEGMEEGEFSEAKDNMESIIADYNEVSLSDEDFQKGVTPNTKKPSTEYIEPTNNEPIFDPPAETSRKLSKDAAETGQRPSQGPADTSRRPSKEAAETSRRLSQEPADTSRRPSKEAAEISRKLSNEAGEISRIPSQEPADTSRRPSKEASIQKTITEVEEQPKEDEGVTLPIISKTDSEKHTKEIVFPDDTV